MYYMNNSLWFSYWFSEVGCHFVLSYVFSYHIKTTYYLFPQAVNKMIKKISVGKLSKDYSFEFSTIQAILLRWNQLKKIMNKKNHIKTIQKRQKKIYKHMYKRGHIEARP